jgi:hypothetical protein
LRSEAVVLSVWEPLTVSAIRLAGLGGGVNRVIRHAHRPTLVVPPQSA